MDEQGDERDFWILFAGTQRGAINNKEIQCEPFYTYDEAEQQFFKLRNEPWVMRAEIYHYPAIKLDFKQVLMWIRS